MKLFRLFGKYLLTLLLFNLVACATMQPVSVPENGRAPDAIEVGSRVELLTLDGSEHTFTVSEVNEQGIGGDPGFFNYGEIDSLQVKVPGESSVVLGVVIGLAISLLFWYFVDEATTATLSPGL